MTIEEAYEKLDLPVGSDLQEIRKKFAEMHNDYRMQIDNAFNINHKHSFEQKLEELKEAYAVLNESEGIDDSLHLPRINKCFDDQTTSYCTPPEELNTEEQEWSVERALSLFGLNSEQDIRTIDKKIKKHISTLQNHHQQAKLPTVKQAYQQEIVKAEHAYQFLKVWFEEKINLSEIKSEKEESVVLDQAKSEPLLWYSVVKVVLIIATAVMLLSLFTLPGRLVGPLASSYWWVIATVISSAIILNFFSSLLVPPFLNGRWFKGMKGLGLLLFLVAGGVCYVALLYTFGAKLENNFWIQWEYYQEICVYGLVVLFILWLIVMLLCFIIGLVNPNTFYFKKRDKVIQVIVLMGFYQFFLLWSLQVGPIFANYHVDDMDESTYANDNSLLLDSVYEGVDVDSLEISEIEMLKKYADEGDVVSQYSLGLKYAAGDGVVKDDALSSFWYKKSAGQGYADAQVELAWNYDHGLGVKKNEKKAHDLYLQAAEQGHATGQYYAGWNYVQGVGITMSRQTGIMWLKRAARQGQEDAIDELKKLGVTNYNE